MNNFFKTFWAALLAFVVANILIVIVGILIFAGIAASFGSSETVTVKPNSVLKINFAESITDSPQSSMPSLGSLAGGSLSFSKNMSLINVLNAIDKAAEDDNIKGIYINYEGPGDVAGTAQMEELRDAVKRFKESGKFIVSYNNTYSQGLYWLCSLSDKVFINPEGELAWRGMASSVMFYKGLLDKLGVEVEVLRHGTYKSAVEPYITDKMSPANRLQMETLVGSIWGTLVEDIASARGINADTLMMYADQLSIISPEAAQECHLVDGLMYQDQVDSYLSQLVNGEDADSVKLSEAPEMISLGDYTAQSMLTSKKVSKNKVAIVYADGEIVDGKGSNGEVGGATLAAKLAKARKDKNVKSVVFRVNSPGGSALASEVIWREVELLRQQKPVIVSMGSYAASGGYYISSPSDVIMCDRSTLTGSIGVFGLVPNAGNALKDKLGITVDIAKTSPSADMGSLFRPLSSQEREFLLYQIEQVYGTFVNHVADGRNMTFDEVDAIGQGRVWSGVDAKEIGLVDGFGSLTDAIALAADRAGVSEDYRIYEVVDTPTGIEALLSNALSAKIKQAGIRNQLGDAFIYYNSVMNMIEQGGVQARMPYAVEIR